MFLEMKADIPSRLFRKQILLKLNLNLTRIHYLHAVMTYAQ